MTELSSSGTVLRPYFLPRYTLLRPFLIRRFLRVIDLLVEKNNFLAFEKWNALHRCKNSLYLPRRALKLLIKSLFYGENTILPYQGFLDAYSVYNRRSCYLLHRIV